MRTQSRQEAIPLAYALASDVKLIFLHLASSLPKKTVLGDSEVPSNEVEIQEKLKLVLGESTLRISKISFFDLFGKPATVDTGSADEDIRAMNALYALQKEALREGIKPLVNLEPEQPSHTAQVPKNNQQNVPLLSEELQAFADSFCHSATAQDKKNRAAPWRKRFLEFVGDLPINKLHQADVTGFLDAIGGYPADDSAKHYENLDIRKKLVICKEHGDVTINKSTWQNNYRAPLGVFLNYVWKKYARPPLELNLFHVSGVKYTGNRLKGAEAQKHLEINDVRQLVTSQKMQEYANNPESVYIWWFTLLALHSGARLDELSSLHPDLDVRQTEEGDWFIDLVKDEKAGVNGRVVDAGAKTTARLIPIHHLLISKGFIEFLECRRRIGDGLLFPFTIRKNSNSGNAGPTITKIVRAAGLRVEAVDGNGGKIAGSHAFRKTFLSVGGECCGRKFDGDIFENQKNGESKLSEIAGHVIKGASPMTDYYTKSYTDQLKRKMLSKIVSQYKSWVDMVDYGIGDCLPTPVLPK